MVEDRNAVVEQTKKRIRIASCEPCRTSKLACDHRQPTCSRCAKRGIPAECVYRQNPFKRIRTGTTSRPPIAQKPSEIVTEQTPATISPPSSVPVTPSQYSGRLYPNPGFLGSSSLTAVLNELGNHAELGMGPDIENLPRPADTLGELTRGVVLAMNDGSKVEEGANILNLFLESLRFDDFKNLFDDWYGRGIELNLGMPYLTIFVEAIAVEVNTILESSDRRASLLSLSRRLFENGNKPLVIYGSMTLRDFCDQYTGENLRWETVGVILTFIGMAAIEVRVPHAIAITDEEAQRLRMQMVEGGDTCISFCESFDNLNDVQIVLLFINCLLHSLFNGDQSFKTWRRLNDVTSALFAFGLHEEIEEGPETPFFLVELRKRIFARIYAADISFSTFLGRPPRVSKRFCCIHIPLDMNEEAYFLEDQQLAEELSHLDANGWNTKGQIRKSAVVRWGMMTAMIREELLELLLGRNTASVPQRIAKLRLDTEQAWTQLPSFLKTNRYELWAHDRPPRDLDTLHIIRLLHIHNLFLIERAVTRHSRERSDASVLIASEMLTWVNDAIVRRERMSKLGLSGFAWKVVAYALPAAGVLALELLQQSRRKWSLSLQASSNNNIYGTNPYTENDQALTMPISRTQAIQDISILVAHMDVLITPGDGNYQLFHQAKRALQSILDIILAPPPLNPAPSYGEPRQFETPSTTSAVAGDVSGANPALGANGNVAGRGVQGSNGFPLNDWVLYDQWGFDGDFWSSLADHPLLLMAENENLGHGGHQGLGV